VNGGEPLIRWEWVTGHVDQIGQRLVEHVILAGLAVLIGFLISLALSLLIRRRPWLYEPVTWVSGVLYVIPSIALFALLIPITGLSLLTAEIGLVSYTLLILIRNIVGGLRGIPADVRESAVAMGFTPRQVLWRVEFPIAIPVIIAGLRVAAVSTIGLTTVTGLIGQGGFGAFILEGIVRAFTTLLIIGALGSVALAIFADGLLVLLQRWTTPWTRARW
jgi:osmoprotectant transport system permease protein